MTAFEFDPTTCQSEHCITNEEVLKVIKSKSINKKSEQMKKKREATSKEIQNW